MSYGINQKFQIRNQVKALTAEPFLATYISKLDEEVFDECPQGVSPEIWYDQGIGALFKHVTDIVRLSPGWAIVYSVDLDPRFVPEFIVLSELNRTRWLYGEDIDGNKIIVGAEFIYSTPASEALTLQVEFDDDHVYFVRWDRSYDSTQLAQGDVTYSIWTVAMNLINTRANLATIGSKPGFKVVITGSSAPDDALNKLYQELEEVDLRNALIAKENVITEVKDVSNGNAKFAIDILNKQIELFAFTTRLPLSYYLGERKSGGGIGSSAEEMDDVRVYKKRLTIWNKMKPFMKAFLKAEFDITAALTYPKEITKSEVIEGKEEGNDNVRNERGGSLNGEGRDSNKRD